jgi:sulfotransferase
MKEFVFLTGMPRSGSTLLTSLLNQHPDVYASTNSPILEYMVGSEDIIYNMEQYQANPRPRALRNVISSMLPAFYEDKDEPLIIDKSRIAGHPVALEVINEHVGPETKFIVMLRPTLEVLASFIKLMRANPIGSSAVDKGLDPLAGHLDDRRCDRLMAKGSPLSMAIESVENLKKPQYSDRVFFVDYDTLVSAPDQVMVGLESFLGLPHFDYDLGNIVNPEPEKDKEVYGLDGMHSVRPRVEKTSPDPNTILSEYVRNKYNYGGTL